MRRTVAKSTVVVGLVMVMSLLCAALAFAGTAPPASKPGDLVHPNTYKYITYGTCNISESGGQAILSGKTKTGIPVDTVGLDLSLQRWNGSSWVTVNGWNFAKNNSNEVDGTACATVASGYYYRTYAMHSATEGAYYEYGYSASGSLLF